MANLKYGGRRTSYFRMARRRMDRKFKLTDCTAVLLVFLVFSFMWIAVEYLSFLSTAVNNRFSKTSLSFLMPDGLGRNYRPRNLHPFKSTTLTLPEVKTMTTSMLEENKAISSPLPQEMKVESIEDIDIEDIGVNSSMETMPEETKARSEAEDTKVKKTAATISKKGVDMTKTMQADGEITTTLADREIKTTLAVREIKTTLADSEMKTALADREMKTTLPDREVPEGTNIKTTTTILPSGRVDAASKVTQADREIIGWEKGKSRDPTKYIEPFKDTTIISGQQICKDPNIRFVIICTSRPHGFLNRAAIRETWASHNVPNVKVGFLIGLSNNRYTQRDIQMESKEFQDIIQENFVDAYLNLTLKSIVLLKWYIRWCPQSSRLMKVDDDTFVDVKMLVRHLDSYRPLGNLVGFLYNTSKVVRGLRDKWYVPRYLYPGSSYPPYLDGPAYFMSRDVAMKLYATALETPLFHIEDVYLTGICAQKANVELQHFEWSSKFERSFLRYVFLGRCLPHHVTCHPLYPWQMRYLWKRRNAASEVAASRSQALTIDLHHTNHLLTTTTQNL